MDFNFIGTIWSLLPPVVAIGLALKTKEVYSSLFKASCSAQYYIVCQWAPVLKDS